MDNLLSNALLEKVIICLLEADYMYSLLGTSPGHRWSIDERRGT